MRGGQPLGIQISAEMDRQSLHRCTSLSFRGWLRRNGVCGADRRQSVGACRALRKIIRALDPGGDSDLRRAGLFDRRTNSRDRRARGTRRQAGAHCRAGSGSGRAARDSAIRNRPARYRDPSWRPAVLPAVALAAAYAPARRARCWNPRRRCGGNSRRMPGTALARFLSVLRQKTGSPWVSRALQVGVVPIPHTGVTVLRHPERERRGLTLGMNTLALGIIKASIAD